MDISNGNEHNARILVVDDHQANIDIVRSFLEAAAIQLQRLMTGRRLWSLLRPPILTWSCSMKSDGYDTCRRFKSCEERGNTYCFSFPMIAL